MNKTPISIIIDDPAPVVHVYRHHIESGKTLDGRELLSTIPNSFLNSFVNVIERNGIKGKFSVVPMAACLGNLKDGYDGIDKNDVAAWIRTVQSHVMPSFAICPELLTHHKAYDMHGGFLEQNEQEWVRTHNAQEIAEYIGLSLRLLDNAGLHPTGVTSPWNTGIEVEDAYSEGISKAFYNEFNINDSWYFLHTYNGAQKQVRPEIKQFNDGRRIVSVFATFDDAIWQCIDTTESSDDFVSTIADYYVTADGTDGELGKQLKVGTWPVLKTHWQSLYSNGLWTGLRVLDEVGKRINKFFGERVVWSDFTELMNLALEQS